MIKVVELFAGVGGFRVGLNNVKLVKGKVRESKNFKFVFFNQWEPKSKNQFAYNCYISRFLKDSNLNNSNVDINLIDKSAIPNHDLLVGGFPCQDYSVATTLVNSKGLEGKKGILWWEIHKILKEKKPKFLLFENVDRLLISPSKNRGKDFSTILKSLSDLNYYVEWKIINAADYGMPQKRKRIFIFACKKNSFFFKNEIKKYYKNNVKNFNFKKLINNKNNFFNKSFDFSIKEEKKINLNSELKNKNFKINFFDFGIMLNINNVYTFKTKSIYEGKKIYLKNILINKRDIDKKFIISENRLDKVKILKSKKKITKKNKKTGHKYNYSEGRLNFPDNINLPSRTLVTSEGSLSRMSHFIEYKKNKYRYLLPIECERLNMFPDNWTKIDGITDKQRYFLMGNALVCGIINRLSLPLKKIIKKDIKNNI
ncbi:DNA (cytosine-5-)-methyltransferase [Mycoplasmoides pirum]|uniref:DNA (cytosine-5-)-methyltransferase n=1 Tax=Mycoplasmoides pirum TaxID=2122 RepID=UPI000698F501|nr:DNA (cytosine-5-)-methyltransferase [Mycoplasmoides pirum]